MFKDYRDLPFSRDIQDELFKNHFHLSDQEDKIAYYEEDVIEMLKMQKDESKKIKEFVEQINIMLASEMVEFKDSPSEGRLFAIKALEWVINTSNRIF